MSVYEATVAKIRSLPEPLVQQVNDFVDFLLARSDPDRWQLWQQFSEATSLAEADMPDYLTGLQDYEEQLARGDVKW